MTTDHGFPADRAALTRRLFPDGVPALWSPTLVFYDEAGGIDRDRLFAHLDFMAAHVKGFLVPGSTGDAWEMRDDEAIAALDFAEPRGLDLLAGVLRPSAAAMRTLLDKLLEHLRRRTGTRSVADCFAAARVRGVTVAAPSSATPLPQEAIGAALEPLFALGLPMALYQLPQVTGNTMAPDLVADLARRFPNLLLFKDSGGADEVALSGRMPAGVTLLRGAEGDYARWSKAHGGPVRRLPAEHSERLPGAARGGAQRLAARPGGGGGTPLGGRLRGGLGRLRRRGRGAAGQRLHQRQQGARAGHGLRQRRPSGAAAAAVRRRAPAAPGDGAGRGFPWPPRAAAGAGVSSGAIASLSG